VEHTGTWLFKRKEFVCWENSKTPELLWLHGIRKSACLTRPGSLALIDPVNPLAGAGKTKLVCVLMAFPILHKFIV